MQYIEYEIGDGRTLLVESTDKTSIDAYRGPRRSVVKKVEISFQQALESVRASAMILLTEFADLEADEVEVVFGLNAVGEAGNFAIGKVGLGANYELKMKWKRPENGKNK